MAANLKATVTTLMTQNRIPGICSPRRQVCVLTFKAHSGAFPFQRQFKKIGHIDDSEDESDECGHVPTLWILEYPRVGEPEFVVLGFKFTTIRGEHILNPLRGASVRESNDEPIASTKHHHRRSIWTMALPSDVDDHAHSRSPSGERSKNPVGDVQIETGDPSR
jgi:hypothetical protein